MKSALTTPYGYARKHRALEIVCIAAGGALLVAFCFQVPRSVSSLTGWVTVAATGFAAYVAADLVTGVVHWSGDTLGHEEVWFLGPHFIRPFRDHHHDQQAITRHDFIETNGNNSIVMCGPLALAYLLLPDRESIAFFACVFLAFLCLFTVATNQFHKWAHLEGPPAVVGWLQRRGLILSPAHHQIHHRRPHDTHYCITVGWMNPVLNHVRFFRTAEWVVARLFPSWLNIENRPRPRAGYPNDAAGPADGYPAEPVAPPP